MSDVSAPLTDLYFKLRPEPATPAAELCGCESSPPLFLRAQLVANPLACVRCNREVRPEAIGFGSGLAEDVAFWARFHDSFYYLWLESGEFEAWAAQQLGDANSVVNVRGLALVKKLSAFRRCYLWWFTDDDLAGVETPVQCPRCAGNLHGMPEGKRGFASARVCEACAIAVPTNIEDIVNATQP